MKQRWTTPQLIQLSRGNPEEAVLTSCKNVQDPTATGPSAAHDACAIWWSPCGTCSGIYQS